MLVFCKATKCCSISFWITFYFNFLMFISFWERERETELKSERGREREKERHGIWGRLQALSCEHRTWCVARTHGLRDYDLSWSWMFNQPSHPGAPPFEFLNYYFFNPSDLIKMERLHLESNVWDNLFLKQIIPYGII